MIAELGKMYDESKQSQKALKEYHKALAIFQELAKKGTDESYA